MRELTIDEMEQVSGGNPWLYFIAGAIAGGIIYDVAKAGAQVFWDYNVALSDDQAAEMGLAFANGTFDPFTYPD